MYGIWYSRGTPAASPAQAVGAAGKLAYVIIRPGGLKSEPATGKAILTEDAGASGMIHREDVASLVAKALFSKKADSKVRGVGGPGGWGGVNAVCCSHGLQQTLDGRDPRWAGP
jgi:hypothetical protein